MKDDGTANNAENKPRLICLCGCLCAGKSTMAMNIVSMSTGALLLKEDLTQHPIYRDFQGRRAGWMETQLEFYVRWGQLICQAEANPSQTIVVDHSIDVHHNVYSRVAHDLQEISDTEWDALCVAYARFRALTASRYTVRNLVLQVCSETLISRMQSRSRDFGDKLHLEFLNRQLERFKSWANGLPAALIIEEIETVPDWSNNTVLRLRVEQFIESGMDRSV
jgi:deoxyadenosine/deoxycytidine kinase